jgi:mitochondrial fission protein ELM1
MGMQPALNRDSEQVAMSSPLDLRLVGSALGHVGGGAVDWLSTRSRPLIVWRFVDGKPGHMQQSQALVRALARRTLLEVSDVPVLERRAGILHWMAGRWKTTAEHEYPLERPDVLIGAGHRTHMPILMSRQAFGGKAVVLMKPSLPMAMFDKVIVPEHDGVADGGNRVLTRGALNTMRPQRKKPASGLVMIGGPGKHFTWSDDRVIAQVEHAMATRPDIDWLITDSRRTPAECSSRLLLRFGQRYMSHASCPQGWLANQLGVSSHAWVTEDSMSMIYESLSAGCHVGLIRLAPARESRIVRSTRRLVEDAWVSVLDVTGTPTPVRRQEPLGEADRIATLLLQEWGLTA